MDWKEARDSTLVYWKELRDVLHEKDETELLTDINAVNDLCQKARNEADGAWGRCRFCIAYQQFGGCTGVSLRMSECVVDRDLAALRELVDWFIEQLESLSVSEPGASG